MHLSKAAVETDGVSCAALRSTASIDGWIAKERAGKLVSRRREPCTGTSVRMWPFMQSKPRSGARDPGLPAKKLSQRAWVPSARAQTTESGSGPSAATRVPKAMSEK